MKFHDVTKEMYLSEYYPGIAVSRILEKIGFVVDTSRGVESKPPTEDELRILRDEVDPYRLILG